MTNPHPIAIDGIVYLTYVPIGISATWCAGNFKRLRPEFRVLTMFVFLSALVQGASEVMAQFGVNNLPLSHGYALLGLLVLTHFYQRLLHSFIPVSWFTGIRVGFTVFALITILLWQPLLTFNSYTWTAEAVIVLILVLSLFVLTLHERFNHPLQPILPSLNWINSGFLIYFAGNLFLFYNGTVIVHAISGIWTAYTWLAHALFTLLLHTCLLIGLWTSLKT